jgi:hypothetical protein
VKLHVEPRASQWDAIAQTFTFRHQDGCFRLIGYDSQTTQRSTGATLDRSINHLTRSAILTRGSQDSKQEQTRHSRLPGDKVLYLEALGNVLEFSPES